MGDREKRGTGTQGRQGDIPYRRDRENIRHMRKETHKKTGKSRRHTGDKGHREDKETEVIRET